MLQQNRPGKMIPLTWALVFLLVIVFTGVILGVKFLLPNLESVQPPQQNPIPTSTSTSPTSTPYSKAAFEVLANQGWQSTGVQVKSGDLLSITFISGIWSGKTGNNLFTGPERGHPSQDYNCNPLPHKETGYNALIGKIWYGKPFVVGRRFLGSADISGTLYLRMNDCDEWLEDNEGSIVVNIQLSH